MKAFDLLFEIPIVLILGFVLDSFLGDPDAIPHPIVLIGKMISALESVIRKFCPANKGGELIGGSILGIVVIAVSFLIPFFVLLLITKVFFGFWGQVIRLIVEVFWCWQILSARTLAKEAYMVYQKVRQGDLYGARNQVARIVGRDTSNLSMEEVIKACIETVAESTSDGVVAPLFYMTIGGIPLGFLYKATNTLDSMVGYRNDRYRYFGSFSARMDDILNFIPARITALVGVLMAGFINLDRSNAFKMWKRDRLKHLSPNSGNPESVWAGALNIQLGGDAYYFGKRYEKATLGNPDRYPEAEDINRSVRLMYVTSIASLIAFISIRLLIAFIVM